MTAYFLVFLTPIACAGAHDSGVQATQEAGVTAPSGLLVSVALASAHLGAEGCTHDESGGLKIRSCAVSLDAGAPGTGPCGGPCELSSVVLAFSSGSGTAGAHIQVTKVAMLDGATGQELQALSAYTPVAWSGTQYVAWDETVAPSSQINTSYTLSPPSWSTLGPSYTYSHQYNLQITILVDGKAVTLESPPLTRPAPLST
jgi:hypothetical protein